MYKILCLISQPQLDLRLISEFSSIFPYICKRGTGVWEFLFTRVFESTDRERVVMSTTLYREGFYGGVGIRSIREEVKRTVGRGHNVKTKILKREFRLGNIFHDLNTFTSCINTLLFLFLFLHTLTMFLSFFQNLALKY